MKRVLAILLALLAWESTSFTPPARRWLAWTYMPIEEGYFYEIWRSTNLPAGFAYWTKTTNNIFLLPFNLPREFFRVRVVTPSGTSDWATVQ